MRNDPNEIKLTKLKNYKTNINGHQIICPTEIYLFSFSLSKINFASIYKRKILGKICYAIICNMYIRERMAYLFVKFLNVPIKYHRCMVELWLKIHLDPKQSYHDLAFSKMLQCYCFLCLCRMKTLSLTNLTSKQRAFRPNVVDLNIEK